MRAHFHMKMPNYLVIPELIRQAEQERTDVPAPVGCIKHRCQAAVGEGAACQISSDCQDGMQCLVAGAPPPKGGIPP